MSSKTIEFKRYNSLLNSYEIKDKLFRSKGKVVVSEKIDGSNFSVYISPNEIKFAKRTGFIYEDGDLFGWKSSLEASGLQPILEKIQADNLEIVLVGEYYGNKVRSAYGQTGSFVFFDAFTFNGDRVSFDDFTVLVKKYSLPSLDYYTFDSISEAIKTLPITWEEVITSSYKDTLLARSEEEFEGWVIRGVDNSFGYFGIKHKTSSFTEVDPSKLKDLAFNGSDDDKLYAYLTEPRVHNILSHGIEVKSLIELADLVIADAVKESGLEIKNPKMFYSTVMPMLKNMEILL